MKSALSFSRFGNYKTKPRQQGFSLYNETNSSHVSTVPAEKEHEEFNQGNLRPNESQKVFLK